MTLDVGGEALTLKAAELKVESRAREGLAIKEDGGYLVALDTTITPELHREGMARDLVRAVQNLRKDAGLELTDRITLTLPAADADLLEHADWIKAETLAVAVDVNGGSTPAIAPA